MLRRETLVAIALVIALIAIALALPIATPDARGGQAPAATPTPQLATAEPTVIFPPPDFQQTPGRWDYRIIAGRFDTEEEARGFAAGRLDDLDWTVGHFFEPNLFSPAPQPAVNEATR